MNSRNVRFLVAAAFAVAAVILADDSRSRASQLYSARDFEGAAHLLEKVTAADPRDLNSRLLLGLSWQQAGEKEKAESVFEKASSQWPKHPGARYFLARIRYLRGQLDQAEADTLAARDLGEAAERVFLLMGLIRAEQGRHQDALAYFAKSSETAGPQFPEPWIQRSVLLRKLGKPGEAVRLLEEARSRGVRSTGMDRQLLAARADLSTVAPAPNLDPAVADGVLLRDIAAQSGIHFVLENSPTPGKRLIETMPGGVAAFDYDGDGRIDLFFTNGAAPSDLRKSSPKYYNRLYRNLGNFRFEDRTEAVGLTGEGYSMGAAVADFDNDGWPDLFVAGVKANRLYRNRGDGGFEDITSRAGIASREWSVGGAWLDFDRDGLLDLFVVNYLDWSPERDEPYCGDRARNFRVYCHPKHYAGTSNRLYRNLGDGRFEDISRQSGIGEHIGKGMSAAIGDYDRDGWVDIFVANDQMPNFLFRNTGKGRFEETGLTAGVALMEQGTPVSSMGSDLRDFDNDGAPDLIVTALAGEMFPLFRNQKDGTFRDVTLASRIGNQSENLSGWGVAFVDLNNDGWKDIFSANSHVTDNIAAFSRYRYRLRNSVLINRGPQGFAASSAQLPGESAHRGAAFADLNGDGRVDAVVTALSAKPELWRNESTPLHWLGVQLRGTRSNRDGIGAVVQVGDQTNQMTTAVGYASSSRDAVHFGLGSASHVPEIRVTWPSGSVQVVRDVAADRILRITEP